MKFITLILFVNIVSGFAWASETGSLLSTQLSWEYEPETFKAETLDSAQGKKILWWNIACGNLNSEIKQKEGKDFLYTNISTLAKSATRPDVLILGEHCPTPMPSKTKKNLAANYPHVYSLPKSNPFKGTNNGIVVYSRFPLELIRIENLDVGQSPQETKDTTRTYTLLKVSDPDGAFYLSPLHLYNPWGKMSMGELILKAMGTDNPNFLQAEMHLNFLKQDVDLSQDPVLVIGDFNAAKNFFLYSSMAAYSLYAGALSDRSGSEATFPTLSASALGNSYPSVQIDHAFSSSALEGKSIMLQLKGSDHYPILFSY